MFVKMKVASSWPIWISASVRGIVYVLTVNMCSVYVLHKSIRHIVSNGCSIGHEFRRFVHIVRVLPVCILFSSPIEQENVSCHVQMVF